jgi:hypothetical protein
MSLPNWDKKINGQKILIQSSEKVLLLPQPPLNLPYVLWTTALQNKYDF